MVDTPRKRAEPQPNDDKAVGDGGRTDRAKPAARPILVVDDDAFVRDSLSVLLETIGFAVRSYASGSELLAGGQHGDAGCLIIDQHMPGLDGLTTLAALRRDGSDLPTILITGRGDAEIAARAAELGAIAVLEKPFTAARLLELARAALEQPS